MIAQLSNVHYIQQSIVVEMSEEFKISVALLSESVVARVATRGKAGNTAKR